MKVSLVVASGAHEGKVIPITGPLFVIGRDPQCHLRPASQAISKKHCGVLVRDGQVFVVDYGSTNGTLVNDELIKGAEVAVESGASVKLGPLDFTVRVEQPAAKVDGTPLPASTPEAAAALAAVKAAAGTPAARPAGRDNTPSPEPARKPAKPGSKEAPALTPTPKPAAPKSGPVEDANTTEDDDKIAAMLLGMDDGEPVPDGSTVMEMPSNLSPEQQAAGAAKPDDKNKKPVQTREDMTNAASDLLRKMMRRPK